MVAQNVVSQHDFFGWPSLINQITFDLARAFDLLDRNFSPIVKQNFTGITPALLMILGRLRVIQSCTVIFR